MDCGQSLSGDPALGGAQRQGRPPLVTAHLPLGKGSVRGIVIFLCLCSAFAVLLPQNAMSFPRKFHSAHDLVHRFRAQVNPARPIHAAKIRVNRHRVENTRFQQSQEHPAASRRFDRKNSLHPVVERNIQPVSGKRCRGYNPNHDYHIFQRLNFGRVLIAVGQIPGLAYFNSMQGRPSIGAPACRRLWTSKNRPG